MNIIQQHLPNNCYSRSGFSPRGILIHYMSAKNVTPLDPYNMMACRNILHELGISAHWLIGRDGTIWELAPETAKAYHAGRSRFRDLRNLNSTFFGIEFVGDSAHQFTDTQYRVAAQLVRYLRAKYSVPSSWIRGHQEVSDKRARPDPKIDPGYYFDWVRFGFYILEIKDDDDDEDN